jgi:hypothetical protein
MPHSPSSSSSSSSIGLSKLCLATVLKYLSYQGSCPLLLLDLNLNLVVSDLDHTLYNSCVNRYGDIPVCGIIQICGHLEVNKPETKKIWQNHKFLSLSFE